MRELLGETESDIADAARYRLIYVFNDDADSLAAYQESVRKIPLVLRNLRQLTADNPVEQRNLRQPGSPCEHPVQLWERSIALRKSGAREPAGHRPCRARASSSPTPSSQ
ncbi:MAG: CHASE3 domain-containing protein [Acidobacteria bacterium]|nr:CHASE3 domain-containing protein [Acidobacteriota bacterium]